jgi:hypothetical protein
LAYRAGRFCLRGELDAQEVDRLGLDDVGCAQASEGVSVRADAQLVAAEGAEFCEQVGEAVGGQSLVGVVACGLGVRGE